ncbi:Methylamine utilization protein mauG precursor [Collimonas arenae]|uniref:Methylamine utilization protein mauG n=1 Tax=Collimonas arenae TaxID=279058 RepID=A0A0A1FG20_9BURK|nr:cytochrome c peroxidase [Collimonas arenae]AIY41762.1 Methylamine utilization protein mauG precursor [Collimonas arenae]
MKRYPTLLLAAPSLLLALAGCDRATPSASATTASPPVMVPVAPVAPTYQAAPGVAHPVTLSAVAQLGKKIFFDPSLSGSGKLACASCHSPDHAYAPPNNLAVQLGGPKLDRQGLRAVPSLRYLEHTPTFTIGPNKSMPDSDAVDAAPATTTDIKVAAVAKSTQPDAALLAAEANVPMGGLDWDGRADTLQNQAQGPFLDPNEMDNKSAAALLEKLRRAPYAEDLRKLFGANVFDNSGLALSEALFALGRFQMEDPSFHPYDSKYDYYLAGQARLSAEESRGLKLFDGPKKGNCASCHIDKPSRDGMFPPAFTDYQFEALAGPRNKDLLANRDPKHYDLGLCGPMRSNYKKQASYCGLFKTPTLRNSATRGALFHNGVFKNLDDLLHFYVERETDPGKWYPKRKDGSIDKYDDLPPQYKKNVDVVDAPFDRKHGDAPALNADEIKDMVAFLKTLNDGYQPGAEQSVNSK